MDTFSMHRPVPLSTVSARTYIHGSRLVQGLVRVVVDFVSQAGADRPELPQPHVGDAPGRLAIIESLSRQTKQYTSALFGLFAVRH